MAIKLSKKELTFLQAIKDGAMTTNQILNARHGHRFGAAKCSINKKCFNAYNTDIILSKVQPVELNGTRQYLYYINPDVRGTI
jgi:hypothetical protein